MLRAAIVGLSNAGKSTLFNRLVGRKASVVSSISGVTRDRLEGIGRISDLVFKIVDTGGWNNKTNLSMQIIEQIEFSLSISDLIFFLVDAKVQNEQNKEFAKWLKKKTNKPVILTVNKCESYKLIKGVDYLRFLNFIGPIYISAEHNLGMVDLYNALTEVIKSSFIRADQSLKLPCITTIDDQLNNTTVKNKYTTVLSTKMVSIDKIDYSNRLRIAVIGRQNVGKSTFLNGLLKEHRVVTSSEPGTTRDSVDMIYNYNGRAITMIDTAGIRKKLSGFTDNLESRFIEKSVESIKRSHVIILMLDPFIGIRQQDLSIGEIALKKGKGIVVVLNKYDLINKNAKTNLVRLMKQQEVKRFLLEVPFVVISALKGIRCNSVVDKCLEIKKFLDMKINTAKLNKWLISTTSRHNHPLVKGKTVKMKYIAQIGTQPPAFCLKCNIPESIDQCYQKYLAHSLRKNFFIKGVPIRLLLKRNKNPYTN